MSSHAISLGANVRTSRRSSTSGAIASLPRIRFVPRTQPIFGAMIVVFAPHGSACARLSRTSSAAFVSPYGPSLPNAPWLGESGSRTVRGVSWPISRWTPSSWSRIAVSNAAPASFASPVVDSAANGARIVGVSGSTRRSSRPRRPPPGWRSHCASASMSENDARLAGTTCSSACGPALVRYSSR